MQTQRKFLQALSTSGLVLLPAETVESEEKTSSEDRSGSHSILLRDGWEFRLDASGAAEPAETLDDQAVWEPVQVPHTWQALGGSPEFVGIAWHEARRVPSRIDSPVRRPVHEQITSPHPSGSV